MSINFHDSDRWSPVTKHVKGNVIMVMGNNLVCNYNDDHNSYCNHFNVSKAVGRLNDLEVVYVHGMVFVNVTFKDLHVANYIVRFNKRLLNGGTDLNEEISLHRVEIPIDDSTFIVNHLSTASPVSGVYFTVLDKGVFISLASLVIRHLVILAFVVFLRVDH